MHISRDTHPAPATGRAPSRFGRYTVVAVLAATILTISFATRFALVLVHGGWPTAQWLSVVRAFASGAVYDVVVTLWLLLPLLLYLTTATSRWLNRPANRALLFGTIGVAVGGALFVAVSEGVFFDEFDGRFNFVAVDYLIYPTEVVSNIWESYPTAWVVLAIATASAAIVYIARERIRAGIATPVTTRRRLAVVGGYALCLAALSLAVSPNLARVSDDRALNEVASNGYYAFWKAFLGQGTSYDALYATRDTAATLPRIHGLLADASSPAEAFAPRTTMRHVAATRPARPLNVVVVLEESLGSQFIGAMRADSAPSLTPRYDSLIAEGTLLTHAYSTGNRTIRALEATTSSLPPLPGVSVVRRPESVDLFTLPALLKSRGYSTAFIYGGRARFDGMGAYMRNNGMERVIEQKDYANADFTTAWGVPDEQIFDKALAEMDAMHATGRPFYTLILSVSNHRPYTYPAGRIAADPNERKRVNAVRYADWSLGRFVRDARRHAFFDNTLFVLMGDHGPRVYGASEIPLASYSVPILLYAPGIVSGGVKIDELASSMDVPPTVLGLLGGSYDSKFFGRDVLTPKPRTGLAVMTHNNEIALMRGHRLAVLGLRGAATVYDVGADGGMQRVVSLGPEDQALVEDAIAYFQTADELYRRGQYRFDRPSTVVAAK
ncbi:MAG TPA: LTA synthase family protein [Gemmatimonadaceae bacterium]|nr:LTA synthase family protein [Gemmatimonadaceae bacterium]